MNVGRHDAAAYERRFWARTEQGFACLRWTGRRHPTGYGQVSYLGKKAWTHRVAWELCNGPIPKGMWILHTCDNRLCVNPDHLWLGTPKDNATDRVRKGRDGGHKLIRRVCPEGHRRIPHPDGRRYCPICKALYDKQRWAASHPVAA